MGIYDSSISPVESQAKNLPASHGGTSLSTAQVLNPTALITAAGEINWSNRDYVAVPNMPQLGTVQEADQAEDEARRYEIAVSNGVRLHEATEKRLDDFARLERSYCRMLAKAGKTATEVLAARRSLAGVLQDQRSALAHLGFGLDRQIERTDRDVELIAAEYGRA